MKGFITTIAAGALLLPALTTQATANETEMEKQAVHYRQAVFSAVKYNFADMAAMLKGKKAFDAEVFGLRANRVAMLATLPAEGFESKTLTSNSNALADIWQDKDKFDNLMEKFAKHSQRLADATASNDKGAIKKAFAATGKACKSCHDSFKKD